MSAPDPQSWVDCGSATIGKELVRYAQMLEARLESRISDLEIYAAVYSERVKTSLRPSRQRNLIEASGTRNANLTFNVGRSLVSTEHATVTEGRPRPTFLTEDGKQPLQDKARELQFAVDGIMSDLRTYDIGERVEIDKGVLGTSCLKVGHVNGRPITERVLISDILVDEELMGNGPEPKAAIHRMEVSRSALLAYMRNAPKPEAVKKAIMDAPAVVKSTFNYKRSDLIAVYDAYALPIDEENPGRHAVAIEGCDEALFVEDWTAPRLPFIFMHWQRGTTGFYGIGIIEQILGIQVEINRFYRTISQGLRRWGGVTCLLPNAGKINTQLWTNAPEGKFIPYDGTSGQVVFLNGPKLSPEEQAWLQYQIDNAYKVTGIPQTVAFAQREVGIPSARGQREVAQKAAANLGPQSKQYERMFIDIAWNLDDVIRKLVKANAKLVISAADQGALHKVDIEKAISLEPGTYHIDVFAGNLLSRHPASRLEELQELAKEKIFTPEEVKKLTQMPDITAALGKPIDVEGIYRRYIKKAVDQGVFVPPEDFWPDLELGKKLYTDALFEGQASDVPEDRLNVLREWLTAAKDIIDKNAPPPAPPAPQQPPMQEAA